MRYGDYRQDFVEKMAIKPCNLHWVFLNYLNDYLLPILDEQVFTSTRMTKNDAR